MSGLPLVDKSAIDVLIDISEDDDLTSAFSFRDYRLMSIQIPSAWTAANLTFKVSDTQDGTFSDLYDSDGNQVVVTAAASQTVAVTGAEATALSSCLWVKIATTAGQAADRTLVVMRSN